MACQVGDGAIVALDAGDAARVTLLGKADSGAYSGETDFLTSAKVLDAIERYERIFRHSGPLRALMVMTDGVADDYFPPNPALSRLYADLVLNDILKVPQTSGAAIPFDPADGRLDQDAEAVTAAGPQRVTLRSAALFASELGEADLTKLSGSDALLAAGARGAPLAALGRDAADRLRVWLDSYQVRGSFDDRTLVVLHPRRA
jgi:hypothetical protein